MSRLRASGASVIHGHPIRILLIALLLFPAAAHAQQETIEYYGQDVIGSIRMVFHPDGTVAARQDYEPFGRPLFTVSAMPKEGFGSQEKDSETNQAYFHARMSSDSIGRFSTPDPVQVGVTEPQRWNRYAYALNNPVRYTDWTGMNANSCQDLAHMDGTTIYGSSACPGMSASMEMWLLMSWLGFGSWGGSGGGGSSWGAGGGGGGGGSAVRGEQPAEAPPGTTDPPPGIPPRPGPAPGPPGPSAPPRTATSCFVRGVATGAAGAVIVGVGAAAAVTLGAPVAAVTGVLGAVALVGGVATGYSTISNVLDGNWNAAAYNVGAIAGGAAAGYAGGNAVARAITPAATKGWSIARDVKNLFNPSLGTIRDWLGTGPDGGAASGSMAMAGSGAAMPSRGGC